MNFYIVLFKDKTKKKIIKKFSNSKKAEDFYNQILKENKDIIFEKLFDNGKPSKYDIGLLSDEKPNQIKSIFKMRLVEILK